MMSRSMPPAGSTPARLAPVLGTCPLLSLTEPSRCCRSREFIAPDPSWAVCLSRLSRHDSGRENLPLPTTGHVLRLS